MRKLSNEDKAVACCMHSNLRRVLSISDIGEIENIYKIPVKSLYLYNKSGYVCLFVCLFRMAGQTAGPIETKLDTGTHVHPGSVSGKVNLKVINVCVRE